MLGVSWVSEVYSSMSNAPWLKSVRRKKNQKKKTCSCGVVKRPCQQHLASYCTTWNMQKIRLDLKLICYNVLCYKKHVSFTSLHLVFKNIFFSVTSPKIVPKLDKYRENAKEFVLETLRSNIQFVSFVYKNPD